MTRTREENAMDLMHEEAVRAAADAEVALSPGLVPEAWEEYENWLKATGRDDSFVGDDVGVPGTYDIYEAAMRAFEAREAALDTTPSP